MIAFSVNQELAASVRRVNSHLEAAGSPTVPALRNLWFTLDADLDRANAAGDEPAARQAINAWQTHAIEAIDEAAR